MDETTSESSIEEVLLPSPPIVNMNDSSQKSHVRFMISKKERIAMISTPIHYDGTSQLDEGIQCDEFTDSPQSVTRF